MFTRMARSGVRYFASVQVIVEKRRESNLIAGLHEAKVTYRSNFAVVKSEVKLTCEFASTASAKLKKGCLKLLLVFEKRSEESFSEPTLQHKTIYGP